MSKDISLDEFQKNLNKIKPNDQVPIDVLFASTFMLKHTNFSSFDDFLTAGNFTVNSQEDFEAIPDADMDNHVRNTTKFSSWEDMLTTAAKEHTLKQLGF